MASENNNETKAFRKDKLTTENEKTSSQSRKQYKQDKKKEKNSKKRKTKKRRGRIRYIPVWLRVILVISFAIGAFYGGMIVGYTILGDGQDADTILNREYWEGLLEYIQGN